MDKLKNLIQEKIEVKKEEIPTKPVKEVPEDVLRKVLE
jgi:hypothetical protein